MLGILLLALLLLEVYVLGYLEFISWRTIYTPLCCLMFPYLLVLLISMAVAGHLGFVNFCYSSISVWCVGLPVFAIPSYLLSLAKNRYPLIFGEKVHEGRYPATLGIISLLLALLFLWRFHSVWNSSTAMFGTDDFAEDFAGHGIWAHLRTLAMPLLIVAVYYFKRKQWYLWGIIFALLLIQLLYMVKGAIIIGVASGLLIRLMAGKMHLNLGLILKVSLGAFAIFLLTYMVLPLLGNESAEANVELFEMVAGHFLHYLTSGTLGFSYDANLNFPDMGNFEILVSPFVNIYKTLTGDPNLLSPVNPLYLHTGISYTNVRTFFGTMFIYCNSWQFIAYTLILSSLIYSIQLGSLRSGNMFLYTLLSYYCGLLGMGWFEFYYFHLAILEVPVMILMLMGIANVENRFREKIRQKHRVELKK